jgi:hypothetical protein
MAPLEMNEGITSMLGVGYNKLIVAVPKTPSSDLYAELLCRAIRHDLVVSPVLLFIFVGFLIVC